MGWGTLGCRAEGRADITPARQRLCSVMHNCKLISFKSSLFLNLFHVVFSGICCCSRGSQDTCLLQDSALLVSIDVDKVHLSGKSGHPLSAKLPGALPTLLLWGPQASTLAVRSLS